MTTIGSFVKTDDGYAGIIQTLTLDVRAKLVPCDGTSEMSPDFRLYAGTMEIGAGWKKTSESQKEFVSLKLDDPSLPHPIYASLFPSDEPESFLLLWSRPKST